MATIRTRQTADGTNRYRVEIRLAGFAPQSKTFAKRAEARAWATQTESALLACRDDQTGQPLLRVSDLIERYVQEVLILKPRDRNQAQQLMWFKQEIGERPLRTVTIADIKHCQSALKSERTEHTTSGQRSNATVNRYMAVFSHALSLAADQWQWIDSSPCLKLKRLPESRGRVRYLSIDQYHNGICSKGELSRLLSACQDSSQPALYPMVVLALSTGLRISEIRALNWRDVDIEHQAILIRTSKNGDPRRVPLTGKAFSLIKALWVKRNRSDNALIFTHPNDTTRAIDITYAWRQALKTAQITDFRFHDLRHTAASYLAMSGATHSEIAQVLGHRTLSMVHRYAHLAPNASNHIVARMNDQWLH